MVTTSHDQTNCGASKAAAQLNEIIGVRAATVNHGSRHEQGSDGRVSAPLVTFDIATYAGLSEAWRRLALVVAEFLLPDGYAESIRDAEIDHLHDQAPADASGAGSRPAAPRGARARAREGGAMSGANGHGAPTIRPLPLPGAEAAGRRRPARTPRCRRPSPTVRSQQGAIPGGVAKAPGDPGRRDRAPRARRAGGPGAGQHRRRGGRPGPGRRHGARSGTAGNRQRRHRQRPPTGAPCT